MANPFNIGVCVVMQLLLPDDRLNDMDEASDDEAPARPELAAEELFAVAQFLLDEIQAIEGVEDAVATMPWFAVLARLARCFDASEPPAADGLGDRVAGWCARELEGLTASPDALVDFLDDLRRRLEKPSAGEKARRGACFTTHVDGESVFGLFLRRTLLDASLRHFDSVVGTYDRLVVYQSAYREDVDAAPPAPPPAAAAAAPRGRAGSFDEEAAPPAPPAPAPVVAASSSSRRAFYLSLLTARQLELYLERRILSVSADVGTSTLEETERELAFLEALEPELPRASFLRYLSCVHHRELLGALDALHRYFDYARARGGPRSPNDAKSARGVAQYAALNLAAVHVRFGHHGLAAIAIDEAVRVAQQRHDHACVTFALSWLKHVDEQEREADADRHGPPLPGEDDGGGANVDALRRAAGRAKELGLGDLEAASTLAFTVDCVRHGMPSDELQLSPSTPAYQPSDLHVSALAAWELLGRATKALEVPGERDGPAAHHLAMTPQQRLARDAEQRRRGLLGEAEGAGLGKDAAITERRTVATDAPRTVVAQAAAKRHAVAGGVWTHFGFRRMSNLASRALLATARRAAERQARRAGSRGARPADGDACGGLVPHAIRESAAADLAFAALYGDFRPRERDRDGGGARVAYAVALRRLERLGAHASNRVSSNIAIRAEYLLKFEWALHRGANKRAEALASALLGVSPVQADLGPEAHVEAVRASARLLARRERWERAVKTMNELERYCGRKGLWAQQAECLMLGAHWRLDACPQSPVPALSPALRCLALCEKFALDHLHAEAAFALGRVNVYLGSVAKARSLIQGALPKLLGHSHVQLQGDAWYALAETELREKAYATKSPEIHKDVVAEGLKDFSRPITYYGRALEAFTYVQNWKRMQDAHYYLSMIHHQLVDAANDACENKAKRDYHADRALKLNDDLNRSQQDLMFFRPIWILPAEWGEYEHDDQTRRDAEPRV